MNVYVCFEFWYFTLEQLFSAIQLVCKVNLSGGNELRNTFELAILDFLVDTNVWTPSYILV